jgi:hypothetical protein
LVRFTRFDLMRPLRCPSPGLYGWPLFFKLFLSLSPNLVKAGKLYLEYSIFKLHLFCICMKFRKTTYLSLFFLFCFTASFGAMTIQNLRTSIHKADPSHGKSSAVSAKEESTSSGTGLLLEKSENESEKSLHVQSLLLPFYISFFQCEVFQPGVFSATPLAEKHANPIYIEVCSFRI